MSPLSPREWSQGNAALDKYVAGQEERYDALAAEFARLETEQAQTRQKTNDALNDLFRRPQPTEEEA
jgi:uncharacterized small protein (DUF1192 family)